MVKYFSVPEENDLLKIVGIGIVWGMIEVFISQLIKGLEPALFGLIMPFLVTIYVLLARKHVPLVGSTFLAGLIAAVMEYLLTGMVIHAAGIAILLEAIGAEIILTLLGRRPIAFLLVGIYIAFYSAYHPLIFRGVFCQSTHVLIYKRWILEHFLSPGSEFSKTQTKWLVIVSHAVMGILAGGIYSLIEKRRDGEK